MSIHGFIVGIENYEDKGLRVFGPARNAVEMTKWLLTIAPPSQIHLFVDPLPISDAVNPDDEQTKLQMQLYVDIAELENRGVDLQRTGNRESIEKFWQLKLGRQVAYPAKLFIFWSGHGITGSKLSRIFLYGDYSRESRSPIFHATNALNELDTVRFAAFDRKIFLADVCGNFPREQPEDHVTEFKDYVPRDSIGYFASRSGAYAKGGGGTGVFTELVLPILKSCAGWPTEKALVDGIETASQCVDVLPFKITGRTPAQEFRERQVGKPEPSDPAALKPAPPAIGVRRLAEHRVALQRLFNERMSIHEGGGLPADAAMQWYRQLNVRGRKAIDDRQFGPAAIAKRELKDVSEGPLATIVGNAGEGARILLLGGGGAGKSTAVLHMAAQAAESAVRDRSAPIPVYLELAPFDAGRTIGGGFERLLQMATNAAARLGLDRPALEALWRHGEHSLLFLLDGLNEVAPDFQESCVLAIGELASRGPPHRYLVTSRPGSATVERLGSSEGRFTAYDTLTIRPDEVRSYLDSRGLAGVYERLGTSLRTLAGTPFLLMALAQSCAGLKPRELPVNLGQLYRRFIDTYVFKKRERAKPNAPIEYDYWAVKRPLCAFLAERITEGGGTRLLWNDALEAEVEARLLTIYDKHRRKRDVMPNHWRVNDLFGELAVNGMLAPVEDENGPALAFSHQSVQEYFAAIADDIGKTPTEVIAARIPRLVWHQITLGWHKSPRAIAHSRWAPTIMFAGLCTDATPLLRSLQMHNPVLAADCLRAATKVDPAVHAELLSSWASLLDSPAPHRRWVGCLCLGGAGAAPRQAICRLGELATVSSEHYIVRHAAIQALEVIDPAGEELLRHIGQIVTTRASLYNWSDLPLPQENYRAIDLLFAAWLAAGCLSR